MKKINKLTKYLDFTKVFLFGFALELLRYSGMNNNLINLIDNKYLFYSTIYSLRLVELRTPKIIL